FSAFEGYTFPGPIGNIYTSSFVSSGRRTGQGILATTNGNLTAAPTSKLTAQADLTYYKDGWIGSHEFQTGIFAQPRLSNANEVRYASGGNPGQGDSALLDPNNPTGGPVPFRRRIYDFPTITSSSRLAQDYAFYLQDSWRPTGRLT